MSGARDPLADVFAGMRLGPLLQPARASATPTDEPSARRACKALTVPCVPESDEDSGDTASTSSDVVQLEQTVSSSSVASADGHDAFHMSSLDSPTMKPVPPPPPPFVPEHDDGAISVGSRLHRTGACTPCKFVRSNRGCLHGRECRRCHHSHEERTTAWIKRNLRALRALEDQRRKAEEGKGGTDPCCVSIAFGWQIQDSQLLSPTDALRGPSFVDVRALQADYSPCSSGEGGCRPAREALGCAGGEAPLKIGLSGAQAQDSIQYAGQAPTSLWYSF